MAEPNILYVEAPHRPAEFLFQSTYRKIFLAGGITDCPNWQSDAADHLVNQGRWIVFNPRRADFPMADPTAAEAQIKWEFAFLNYADDILFWFPAGAIQPIALYELGRWLAHPSNKSIHVGVDPAYPRRQDVEIQAPLARPGIIVHHSLNDLLESIDAKYRSRT